MTRKFSLLLLFEWIFIFIQPAGAQVMFQKTYGGDWFDDLNQVIQTSDSGYLMFGSTRSFELPSGDHYYAIKTDQYGDTLWSKIFEYSEASTETYSVAETAGDQYVFAADESGRIRLLKTDQAGQLIWAQDFFDSLSQLHPLDFQILDDGSMALAGGEEHDNGPTRAFLVKTDSSGNLLWNKIYRSPTGLQVGIYKFDQLHDGGFILAGLASDGYATAQLYLIRTDSAGNPLWSKLYGTNDIRKPIAVHELSNHDLIVGVTRYGTEAVVLIRTDSVGDILWTKWYNTGSSLAHYLEITSEGGYVLCCQNDTGNDDYGLILKLRENGDVEWARNFESTREALYIRQTFDGGYVLSARLIDEVNEWQYLMIKTNELGYSGCFELDANIIADTLTLPVTDFLPTDTSWGSSAPHIPWDTSAVWVKTLCTNVGVNSPQVDALFELWPNPSNSVVTVHYPLHASGKQKVLVHDVLGRLLMQIDLETNSPSQLVNVSSLPQGIYFFTLIQNSSRISSIKFVKNQSE
jgi:hypothetical protein